MVTFDFTPVHAGRRKYTYKVNGWGEGTLALKSLLVFEDVSCEYEAQLSHGEVAPYAHQMVLQL
jgi:hypothetical protein